MATDSEKLFITLEARTARLERDMERGRKIMRGRLSAMERDAQRSANRIGAALSGIGSRAGAFGAGVLASASLAGAQKLIDTATRIENALKVAGLSGAELTKVYDSLFASAQKNAAPLESLVELYSRVSLVQRELGVSGEQLLRFTGNIGTALRVSGTSATEASGALLQLSQALGGGTVRAEEFNSIQEGALPILQAAAAGIEEAGGSVAKLRKLVIDGKLSSAAFFNGFEAGAVILQEKIADAEMTVSQGFVRLQNVLIDAAGKMDDVSGASGKAGQALNTMAEIIEGLGSAVRNFADSDLSHLAGKLYEILNPLGELIDKVGGIQNLPRTIGAIQRSMFNAAMGNPIVPPTRQQTASEAAREALGSAGKTSRVGSGALGKTEDQIGERIAAAFATGVKKISIADYSVDPDGKGKTKKTRSVPRTAESRFNDDIQAVRDRTTALIQEAQAVGLSYQEQERRRMALDLEQAALANLREEARKKGQTDLENIAISAEQRAQIDAVSAGYAKQADALRKVQENQDRVEQASSEFYNSFKSGALDAITGAEKLSDALSGVLKKLSEMLLSSAFDALFKPSTGGSTGGTYGGIFGSIGKLLGFDKGGIVHAATGGQIRGPGGPRSDSIPARLSDGEFVVNAAATKRNLKLLNAINSGKDVALANGGLVGAPSLSAAPMRAPTIPRLQVPANSNSTSTFAPVWNIDARGASVEAVARLEHMVAKQQREFEARVVHTVREARKTRNL
ncbi:tape measure protein [Phyllobacteriaceae bacterium JZ32]